MKTKTGSLLASMMFLEYFIWGAWYVTLGTYMVENLHATGIEIGATYGALAIATMISPFFVGLVADRFFAAQKIMGVLHLLGAVLLFLATKIEHSNTFYWVILSYSLLYTPTIALSNSVAFSQMTDAGKQFPWIRVFGTLGWIVAGVLIGKLGIEKTSSTFYMAAGVSAVLGLLSFVLPNTPPNAQSSDASASKALGTDAFVLFKERPYTVFFIAAILVCIPLSFYYGFANPFLNEIGFENAAGKMTLGQVSEAVFILAIPFLFNRIGVKKMLLMGMAAWILRYVCFAYGNVETAGWMLYAGIILHGICYDFFFVTGYMYTEKKAGAKIKNAAQGLFTFATYGVGMFIGTWYSGYVVDQHQTGTNTHDWQGIWYVPALIALGVLVYFIIFFKENKASAATYEVPSKKIQNHIVGTESSNVLILIMGVSIAAAFFMPWISLFGDISGWDCVFGTTGKLIESPLRFMALLIPLSAIFLVFASINKSEQTAATKKNLSFIPLITFVILVVLFYSTYLKSEKIIEVAKILGIGFWITLIASVLLFVTAFVTSKKTPTAIADEEEISLPKENN